jgi:DNA mismatch repair protein MutL
MPDIIHLLPDSVANQIAAGEVIQRPASVVKELVENSVDSGSTEIKVLLKEAGKSLVQVIDNGCGMSETDARMAFERHATSKIRKAEDLFSIRTMGFRGEALASIAAVSQVEIKTRRKEEEIGTLLRINGSRVESQEPVSCSSGCNITVKNLFYNIPARRRFLKTNSTELRHLIIEFQRIAITLPQFCFSLYHNNSEIYNLPEVNSRLQRISGIFGKGILQNLIPVKTETSIVRVSGYIGKPEFARKTYGEQFFFVNNRYMRHPYFHKAVTEAYEEILQPETIPSYFIFFDIDPNNIDINIHPTKTEIKFEDERSVWQILHASIRESLGKFNVVPSLDFNTDRAIDIPVLDKNRKVSAPAIGIDPGFNPFETGYDAKAKSEMIKSSDKTNIQNWQKLYEGLEQQKRSSGEFENTTSSLQGMLYHEKDLTTLALFHFKNKYILAPVKSGLMVIDQKRAHERILYERFIQFAEHNTGYAQQNLFPQSLELNPADYTLLKEIMKDLNHLGFDIGDLGNNSIIINGFPTNSKIDDPMEIIEVLLETYKATQTDLKKNHSEKIALSLSTASAIPYGKQLNREEMSNLVNNLFACSSPNYSPSGKPVFTIIDLDVFENMLK